MVTLHQRYGARGEMENRRGSDHKHPPGQIVTFPALPL